LGPEQQELSSGRPPPPRPYLATFEMWCWSWRRGILRKLSLCYSIAYCYNGAQRYEQFFFGRLYLALILLGLAPYHPSASVSLHGAIYTVFQNTKPLESLMFDNNFGKCEPIFKVLSPGDS